MNTPEDLKSVLQDMRRGWDERAAENAEYYVFTGISSEEFETSGKINYAQLVRPFLPALLRGRSPAKCRMVEIGCGLGRMTACFAQEFQEVHAIDVSAEMVAKAKERLSGFSNVVLHTGSGMDLAGLPDGYFDLAFSYLVFQHIPSREVIQQYIREAARVLKPGGAFHFQVNGFDQRDYQQSKKDTWFGASFSFSEAIQTLADAGFCPFNSIGAGTQYFILSARRTSNDAGLLSPFILPGQAWPQGQLVEGWPREIPGDCRPVDPSSRVLLGVQPGKRLRFFVALNCAAGDHYPELTVSVENTRIGFAALSGPGDHYWEFPVSPELCRSSRFVARLDLQPLQAAGLVSVRSLGIYAEQEERVADSASESHMLLMQEAAERVFWIANLEKECARLSGTVTQLRDEVFQKISWGRSLENEVEDARAAHAKVRAEFEERTKWALSLEKDLEAARVAWRSSEERAQRQENELRLRESELRFHHDHPWRFLGGRLLSILRSAR